MTPPPEDDAGTPPDGADGGGGDDVKQTDGPSAAELNAKLSEFRENNRKLSRELQETKSSLGQMQKQYGGVDIDMYEKFKEQVDQMKAEEEKTLIKQGKIDEVVARRTAAAIAAKEDELKAVREAYENAKNETGTLKSSLGVHLIERDAQIEIGNRKLKVREGALPDVLSRIRAGWQIDDKGNKVPVEQEGGEVKVRYGKDGNPLGMAEDIERLFKIAPHLFEEAKGGGAGGGARDASTDGKIRIRRSDHESRTKHIEDLATGKAILVDG